jgi:metastasis-associated protein MTA
MNAPDRNTASSVHLQLPWKTLKNIIEYYYMWKTTDRYVQQKRVKAVEAESKLKQVYIPN